ncbi:Rare lipoprotein A [uncultured Caudovirales phage]|uniref:Rare lipoprotein A n=1 Tax=uncultured Caudovirales phage TaxID=2100421 RepID=A0A6J5N7K3_9CAUD|nr:Rare lipoprotein A [uncultured Caudovirales phage]
MLHSFFRFCLAASLFIPLYPQGAQASVQCGAASWYGVGDGFNGRRTASGERFNAYGLTAAHRYLPFGTRVRVTNQHNGKSVVIKITDDGPHYGGRILDLSYGAFSRIAATSRGTADVCIARL